LEFYGEKTGKTGQNIAFIAIWSYQSGMRLRPTSREPILPMEPKSSKLKFFLYFVLILVVVNLYVFVYSPASCNRVKEKIDKTVKKNSKEHIKSVVRGKKKTPLDTHSGNSFTFNIPPLVTGSYDDDVMTREFLMARTVKGTVLRREKFTQSLVRNGLLLSEAKKIIASFEGRGLFNFRRAQPGQTFMVKMSMDGSKAFFFRYNYGRKTILISERTSKGFKARIIKHRIKYVVYGIGFRIGKNIATTLSKMGENYSLVQKISSLFVDEIQTREFSHGDEIKLLVEKRILRKKAIGYGNILAVTLNTREKGEYSVYYSAPGGYFTKNGKSFFRIFMNRPLPGNSVPEKESKFGGIIYPARKSPPVWSISSGVVSSLGWSGPYGRKIEIQHENDIKTVYFHLSRFKRGLKVGDLVSRKGVIGKAGFSGTTPDKNGVGFLVYKGGQSISHYSISAVREPSILNKKRALFNKKVTLYNKHLNQIKMVPGGVSQRILEFGEHEKKRKKRKKGRRKRRRKKRKR
jgi:murein DD-endopeptidase MepM/ murein hydrolase activator NlpD